MSHKQAKHIRAQMKELGHDDPKGTMELFEQSHIRSYMAPWRQYRLYYTFGRNPIQYPQRSSRRLYQLQKRGVK